MSIILPTSTDRQYPLTLLCIGEYLKPLGQHLRVTTVKFMDSLTQLTLGAAIGTAVLGHKVGYRAALWGAVCGTLPDLDVLIPFDDPVAEFTYHRSFSHSLFILTALTPLLVWLILKIHPQTTALRRHWLLLVWLALITHPLLDSLTVYGTQIFWPLSDTPVSIGSIFIIDPFYTVPLLLGLLVALISQHWQWNYWTLALTTAYLGWGLIAQQWVTEQGRQSLARQNIEYQQILATAGPFNSLLWRIVVKDDDEYHEGFYSLLDQRPQIRFTTYPSEEGLLQNLSEHWPVQRLRWFSKGFYKVSEQSGQVVISDLRMGLEPDYVFAFVVAEMANPHPQVIATQRLEPARSWERVPTIMRRIWDEQAL